MPKRVDIIGAGIAGLSAGSYLQINGYNTEVFELHDKPGGLYLVEERGLHYRRLYTLAGRLWS
jgi:phytoene dehydrogenase-like protein